jgi:hypothetical protein
VETVTCWRHDVHRGPARPRSAPDARLEMGFKSRRGRASSSGERTGRMHRQTPASTLEPCCRA